MKQMRLAVKVLLGMVSASLLVSIVSGCQGAGPALTFTLGDFEKPQELERWQASPEVKLERVSDKATSGRQALRITTSSQSWPTVRLPSLSGRSRNWLSYDWLKLDLFNATGDRKVIKLRADDAKQNTSTVITGLTPGNNTLAVPVELFSALELREIKQLSLSILAPGKGTRFYLDNVRLERAPLSEVKTSAGGAEDTPAVVLDFSHLSKAAGRSAFSANVCLPLEDSETIRIIKVENRDRNRTKLTLSRPELTGADISQKLIISSFFQAEDGWHFNTQGVRSEPDHP